jgi:uncharacterized protein (TIGR02246 family)
MAERGSQAVVLGAGMAGLLAARVLSDFYGSVIVIERDVLPDQPEQRKGVPQGRHLHNFCSRGIQLVSELFPGILAEFGAAGAVVDDGDDLSRVYVRVAGHELNPAGTLTDPGSLAAVQASRPFLEFHVRQRVAASRNVTICDNHEVIEPLIAADVVTGTRVINRHNNSTITVDADLVVDAAGRAALTCAFLDNHGFGPPSEHRIPSAWGYSSQLLRLAPGRISERLAYVSQGNTASGALLVAYEHDTWMLAISCPIERGSPPRDFAAMLAVAEQLLPAALVTVLRDGTRLGGIAISRNTAARWRRYDHSSRLPDGLIVLGDALCTLNPLHGQGMTMAALQALALRDCLRAGHTDLVGRFYRAAAVSIAPVWAMNAANDTSPALKTPQTVRGRVLRSFQRAALTAATKDIAVAERILRVRNLVDPPARLQDPALLIRIALANLRRRRPKALVGAGDSTSVSTVSRADEVAIRALLDQQISGWAVADPTAYASVFTLDADYVTFLGRRLKGRDEIATSYAPMFVKLLKGSRLRTRITQLRYLAPDVALIQAHAVVTKPARPSRRGADRVNTSIAVRTEGGWRLAVSQNTTHRRLAEKLLGRLVSRRSSA